MDEEAKQLLREIRDAVRRQEDDNRKANEQNMKTVAQQRTVIWMFHGAMVLLLAYFVFRNVIHW